VKVDDIRGDVEAHIDGGVKDQIGDLGRKIIDGEGESRSRNDGLTDPDDGYSSSAIDQRVLRGVVDQEGFQLQEGYGQ
jgi:hypothetical protein